jgi:hypothetical protein
MKRIGLFILAGLATAGLAVYAQGPPGRGPGGPGFGGAEMLGFEGMRGGNVVQGAPFSAVGTSQTTQTLSDGSHINRTITVTLYRDSQGRMRREVTLTGIGPLQTSGQPRKFILISDPVGGVNYLLNPDKKVAHKMPLGQRGKGPGAAGGQRNFEGQPRAEGAANAQTESLGTQTIGGVKAEGTRVTRTIPAGQIGNDKPLAIVSERWNSPDLKVLVMSKRSDPRFGETTYTLSNIQTKEPDAALFQVPSDYTVKAGAPGQRMGARHWKGQGQGAPGGAPRDSGAPPPPSSEE